jgi:hypothetical protein
LQTAPGEIRFAHGAGRRPPCGHGHGPERLARLELADDEDEPPPAQVPPLGWSVCEEELWDALKELPHAPPEGPPCG